MSCVGQEASGICQLSHKVSEQPEIYQGCHLRDHSLLVIVEPPCTSLLDLAGSLCSLEASEDRSDRLIIIRIQGVENRFLKFIRRDQ